MNSSTADRASANSAFTNPNAPSRKETIVRLSIAGVVGLGLLIILFMQISALMGSHTTLRISGGALLENRHLLARALEAELAPKGINLQVIPTSGSKMALEMLSEGSLDLAIVDGALPTNYENVVHVATINPAPLHLIVKPEIKSLADLKGRVVNFGPKSSGNERYLDPILSFVGLKRGIDYISINLTLTELSDMKADKLPDATFDTNYVPSATADYLVKSQKFQILEIPLGPALALRYPWAKDTLILGESYGTTPNNDIHTVAVTPHLLANARVEAKEIFKLLDKGLYSAGVAARVQQNFDPSYINIPSGYPVAEGTKEYLSRNDPMLSPERIDRLTSLAKIFALIIGGGLVLWRIIVPSEKYNDSEVRGYFEQVAQIEKEFLDMNAAGVGSAEAIQLLQSKLSEIKLKATARLPKASAKNKGNLQDLLICIADARITLSGDVNQIVWNDDRSASLLDRLKNKWRS